MTGPNRGPLTVLLDQCERIVQVHEHLRMDTDEDERVRLKTASTARRALVACREFVDRAYAATPAASASFPRVKGRCPNCGHLTLFLAEGGHVTCSAADCDDPGMADDLLAYAQRWGDRVRSTRLVATPIDSEVTRSARALIELHDDPMLCNTGGPRTAAAIDAIRRALAATPSGAEGEDVAQRIVDAFADARAIRSTGACLMVDFRDGSSADVYDVARAALAASPPAPAGPHAENVGETAIDERLTDCVANWPGCYDDGFDPRCCRFPKACSPYPPTSLPGAEDQAAGESPS